MLKRRLLPPLLALLAFTALMVTGLEVVRADERDFTLVNANPTVTLRELYVSPSDSDEWGDDILGDQVLLPGESTLIYFTGFNPDTCVYDIKVVYDDGGEGYLYEINLCETTVVTFQ